MSIMPPPSADHDVDTIEAHDWAIPCQHSLHERLGTSGKAAYALWRRSPECGCPLRRPFTYFCEPCWELMVRTNRGRCLTCCEVGPFLPTVIRVERI